MEYREARFARNQAADAVRDAAVLVQAAGEWIDAEIIGPSRVATGEMSDLVRDIERDAAKRGIDLGNPPWSTTGPSCLRSRTAARRIDNILGGE